MERDAEETRMTVRLSRRLYQALTALAARERRSLNAQVVTILERAADSQDATKD